MIQLPAFEPSALQLTTALASLAALLARLPTPDGETNAEETEPPRAVDLIIQAFRASPDVIAITRLRDGLLLDINRNFEKLTGFSRAEAIGKTTTELELWADHDRSRMVRLLERDGRTENIPVRTRSKSGACREGLLSAVVLEIDGEPCLVSVVRDVTESKLIEGRLRASEEKFAKAFRSSPDAITISRLSDGTFVDINDGFQQLSGYSYDEAVGSRSTDLGLWLDDERERVVEELERNGRVHNARVRYRMKSSEIRDFLLSGETIELEGEPCLVAISRDITEIVKAERDREQMIERLEAQKAELEQFAYTVSHDLKSPLVTILGFLDLVERETQAEESSEIRSSLAHIRNAAETMRRHLGELLELSRIGRVMNPPQPIRLSDLAHEAATALGGLIEEHAIELDISHDMPTVSGDRFRLLEVFQNLIENGIKFMGGQKAPRIEIRAEPRGNEVICQVRDNGMGVGPRYREKVFELFRRLDPAIEGSGVGLAMVKRIIEVHGGRTWMESAGPGEGSAVFFSLPRSA